MSRLGSSLPESYVDHRMEKTIGPFHFSSRFDSGNLHTVEDAGSEGAAQRGNRRDGNRCRWSSASPVRTKVPDLTAHPASAVSSPSPFTGNLFEYDASTTADCQGTRFQQTSRTWFHFRVTGGTPGQTLKVNMNNMNKQSRLYAQGE